jgi:hypothetical protein
MEKPHINPCALLFHMEWNSAYSGNGLKLLMPKAHPLGFLEYKTLSSVQGNMISECHITHKMIFVDSCLAFKQRPVPHPHTTKFSGKLITDDGWSVLMAS